MPEIRVKTIKDDCVHHFVQLGKSFSRSSISYLLGEFVCRHCGQKREFAVAMTGLWIRKALREGKDYV